MSSLSVSDDEADPFLISGVQEDGTHAGYQLTRGLRRGRLVKLRRGIYVPSGIWFGAYPSRRFSLAAAAASLHLRGAVLCRETALHVQGLPLLRYPDAVQVRAETRHHVRRVPQPRMTGPLTEPAFSAVAERNGSWPTDGTHGSMFRGFGTHHVSPSDLSAEISPQEADIEGVPVQTEPLSLALPDAVPRLSFQEAVVLLDAALRGASGRPPIPRRVLHEGAARLRWTRRRRHLWDRALSFSDSASESPGESFARALFTDLGFTVPDLQVSIDVDGRTYRVDFAWEEAGVVGEFDGWMKYQEEGLQSLREENIREDAVRSTGRRFMRCYWEDLRDPDRLRRKLLRAGVPRAASPA